MTTKTTTDAYAKMLRRPLRRFSGSRAARAPQSATPQSGTTTIPIGQKVSLS